jgi:hypothetical protein
MPRVGFEHTIPASERAKTVHALHHSATVTGVYLLNNAEYKATSVSPLRILEDFFLQK